MSREGEAPRRLVARIGRHRRRRHDVGGLRQREQAMGRRRRHLPRRHRRRWRRPVVAIHNVPVLLDGPRAPLGAEARRNGRPVVPQLLDEVAQVLLLAGGPASPPPRLGLGLGPLILLLGLEAPRERGVGLLLAPPRVAAAALLGLRTLDPLVVVVAAPAPAVLLSQRQHSLSPRRHRDRGRAAREAERPAVG